MHSADAVRAQANVVLALEHPRERIANDDVVVWPRPPETLSRVLHSWKSFTSKAANKRLGRMGEFWQGESYDHLIRDGEQLNRAIRYTAENPAKAGMNNWPYVYVSAEAFGGPANVDISISR